MHYLYRITCIKNGKIYIGQAKNHQHRWRDHKYDAKQEQPKMVIHKAMKKHGINNFVFNVIATCLTLDDANYLETELVTQYESHISLGKGYNVSLGGSNAPKSEAWKQMMSVIMKERWNNFIDEEKEFLTKHLQNIADNPHSHSEENIRHLSLEREKLWNDPAYHKHMSELTTKRMNEPAMIEKSDKVC